jgi:UDP:flavonoid glycosyltransferase YjiC (YdhE family)
MQRDEQKPQSVIIKKSNKKEYIGFLSLPLTGHLNPMTALARKLQSRGHEVVFIGVPDIEPVVRAADLDFIPFCETEYPPGSVAKSWGGVANLQGLDVVRYTARELLLGLVKASLEHSARQDAMYSNIGGNSG